MIDFHLHTWCSDGVLSPSQLLASVRQAGLDAFAVTDHDTIAGWRALAGAPGLIPGVEATAGHHGREVHVVALGFDPAHQGFSAMLQAIRQRRRERLAAILKRLPVTVRRQVTVDQLVDDRAPEAAESVSRQHLAKALVAAGGVPSIRVAFDRWLGDEHLVDPDLPEFPPLAEVAMAIHAAGGVSILAHPGCYRSLPMIEAFMGQGLDGIEVAHPNLDHTLAVSLRSLVRSRGWLASAGSDTHAIGTRRPGYTCLSPDDEPLLDPLCERLGIRRAA